MTRVSVACATRCEAALAAHGDVSRGIPLLMGRPSRATVTARENARVRGALLVAESLRGLTQSADDAAVKRSARGGEAMTATTKLSTRATPRGCFGEGFDGREKTALPALSADFCAGCACTLEAGSGRCVGAAMGKCDARRAAACRDGTGKAESYVANVTVVRTPHQAERLITLRVFYPNARAQDSERCRDVSAYDLLTRRDDLLASGRCRAWFRDVAYERRFEIVRDAIVRYVGPFFGVNPDVDVFVRVAQNPETEFLVVGHDASVYKKPLIPYLLVWKCDDAETVMDGELVERLDAAAAGESFWSKSGLESNLESPRALRSARTLPPAPTVAYELFAGTGEIAVKTADTFPSLRRVYAFEIDGCVVCDAARRHPRVEVVECDLRTMRYLQIPQGALVWCSPPCTNYSPQKRSHYSKMGLEFKEWSLRDADTYVSMCVDFIRSARAENWIIENPLGELRQRNHIWSEIRHIRVSTSYCHYGCKYRKWTDLFLSPALGEALAANGGLRTKCTPVASPCRHAKNGKHPERAAGRAARELARVPMALVGRILRAGVAPACGVAYGSTR